MTLRTSLAWGFLLLLAGIDTDVGGADQALVAAPTRGARATLAADRAVLAFLAALGVLARAEAEQESECESG